MIKCQKICNQLLLIFVLFLIGSLNLKAQFAGGSGTIEDPWQIETAIHLDSVRYFLSDHFIQTTNINLNVAPFNQEEGWEPIGRYSIDGAQGFTGGYDGNDQTILGLTINRPDSFNVGLFGFLFNGLIENVRIINASVTGSVSVGGLVGRQGSSNDESSIINSSVSGTIAGDNSVGGLIGLSQSSGGGVHVIEQSSANVNVSGLSEVGGLIGYQFRSGGTIRVSESFSSGIVSGNNQIGGLVGRQITSDINTTNSIIENSYSTAEVSGNNIRIGGLVGWVQGATINTSYSTGNISGDSNIGGFIGVNTNGKLNNNYWDTNISGINTGIGSGNEGGVDSLTTIEMLQQNSFNGFNFSNIWQNSENLTYPWLSNNTQDPLPQPCPSAFEAGCGTENLPWLITNAEQLDSVRNHLSEYFRLVNVIDLDQTPYSDDNGWVPIGDNSSGNSMTRFSGNFDGGGFTIKNLHIDRDGEDYVGLFGFLENAAIINLGLDSINVQGENFVGGIAGRNSNSDIIQSYVAGNVTGNLNVGGLMGSTANGANISQTYSTVDVTGIEIVGGITGLLGAGSNTITENYAAGEIQGLTNVGAFIGEVQNDNFIESSYWDLELSGQENGIGSGDALGLESLTRFQMTIQSSYESWDFINVWEIDERISYPRLRNTTQNPSPKPNLSTVPVITVSRDSVDFNEVPINTSDIMVLTIQNNGNAPLNISSVSLGTNYFDIDITTPISLQLNDEPLMVNISFTPDSTGFFEDLLTISSNDTSGEREIILTGIGSAAPIAVLSTDSLNFGSTTVGGLINRSFILTNTGNANLEVNDISIDDTSFQLTSPSSSSFTLTPGVEQVIQVSFEPDRIQSYLAQLMILSNAAPTSIVLEGMGVNLSTGIDATEFRQEEVIVSSGSPIPVTINPTGLGDNGQVFVYFKTGGGGSVDSYTKQQMQSGSSGSYLVTLPANLATVDGISYWFEVTDGIETLTSPEMNPNLNPYTISVAIQGGVTRELPQPVGSLQEDYRLISIPLTNFSNNASTILSEFGEANLDSWRLFRRQSGEYVEYGSPAFQTFAPGRGYWFITSVEASLKTGEAQTAPTSEMFSIPLQPGWNMIGSPFYYEISWDNGVVPNGVERPFSYDGNGFNPITTLVPWEGYFVNNSGNNPVELKLSPIVSGGGSAKEVSRLPFDDETAWSIQLKAKSGLVEDNYNFIGESGQADDSKDALDLVNAPNQPGEFLSLGIINEGAHSQKLSVDARKPNSDGHVWDIEILSNSSSEHIRLETFLSGELPANFKIVAFDKDQKTVWALDPTQNNTKTIRSGIGAEITRNFRIVVGTEEFISEHNLGIKDIPAVFELKNNYPNPFNPSTTIVFGLPEASRVTIEVFNTLGQKVATLINNEMEAGYHDFIWDASQVASGVYFYRLSAQGINSEARFSQLQKMTLIK